MVSIAAKVATSLPRCLLSWPGATVGSGFLNCSYQSWVMAKGFSYLSWMRTKVELLFSPCSLQLDVGWDAATTSPWWAAGDSEPGTGLRSAPWHQRSRLCKSGCRVHHFSILARSWVQRQPHASASLSSSPLSSAWALVKLGQEIERLLKSCIFNQRVDLIYTSIETINLLKRLFTEALNWLLHVWSLCVPWRYIIHKSLDSCKPSPRRRLK